MRYIAFAFILLLPVTALAVEPDEMLQDPVLEQRAREISRELRCVVCQNQDIDSSNAGVARDLRILVRDELGVLGQITTALGDAGVSVSRILQRRPALEQPVQVVILTHQAQRSPLTAMIATLQSKAWCVGTIRSFPIEEGV